MMISVIISVYNVEPYLRQCVDSVLAQTNPDLEVLLVDDGSTDGCGEACDAYARGRPREGIVGVRLNQHKGGADVFRTS